MDDTDAFAIENGGKVEAVMHIKYSKDAPSREDIIKSYTTPAATSSNAGKAMATPSSAHKGTPPEANRTAAQYSFDVLNKEIPSPLKALKEEMGIQEDEELKKSTTIGFWVRTTTHKITSGSGAPVSIRLMDNNVFPVAQLVLELPEKDRNMADYGVYSYEFDGDEYMITEVSCAADGRYLTFDGAVDGIYAVFYTRCFDVVFEDWDGSVLSRQRVPYAEAAKAPEAPQRKGFLFVGWSKAFDEVASDLTIKAKYEKGEAEQPADKKRLEKKIEEIQRKLEAMDEEDYTEKTWEILKDALDEAMAVLEKEDAAQKEVHRAIEKLEKAYGKLKKKPEDIKMPDQSDHSDGSCDSESSDKPKPLDGGAYVTRGSWKNTNGRWSFTDESGEPAVSRWIYTLNGDSYEWFYFDENGIMAEGWITLNGLTFYLNPVSNEKYGMMMTGWQRIDGKWYYFSEVSDGTRGRLLVNAKTPDGYFVGKDGAWVE